jgi:putative ABC transport system permease protein
MPRWLKRARSLFRRTRMERELDAELRFHLEMLTAQYVQQGLSPDAARRAARQVFGGVDRIKDEVRDTWLTRLLETVGQDIRYGLRGLRDNRGYAAAVIATMALGIGANTAIFSVVNAVVLQPLPYERGDDLVLLRQEQARIENAGFAIKDIDDIKAFSGALDAVVEYHNMYFILLGGQEPARVATGVVSWNYFDTLGVKPIVGRTFTAGDDAPGAPATLVLSHEYWTRVFDRDPAIVGRVFQMNDRPHTVVGVLPDVPMFPEPNDVYMPRSACPFRMNPREAGRRGSGMASAIGRRKAGVELQRIEADLSNVAARLQREHPSAYPVERGHRLTAVPLRREFTRNFEATLIVLLATTGFVLLIVCASVANLSVARTMRRDRELALRTALGASRARLLRQLVTESLMLAIMGGVAGLLLAGVGMDLLVEYSRRFTARASEIRIDTAVLLFTLGLSLTTGLAAGTIPACSRRFGPGAAATHGRGAGGRRELRRALIVAQVAASFMLLVGAGLMLRSLWKLATVDPGFSTRQTLTMQIDMNFSRYTTARARSAYLDRLLTRLRDLPGVAAVGVTGAIPFQEHSGEHAESFQIEGIEPGDQITGPRASLMLASEDYFRAMEIPLLAGRDFTAADDLDAPGVVIVNRSLAERYWPGADPIGKRVSGDGGRHWNTVVGVIADVRQQLALEPVEELYVPMRRWPWVTTNWVIRAAADLETLGPLVRDAVHAVDPEQPVYRLRPFDDVRAASLAPPRLTATLLGLFAGLALLITATGIAGVIAFSVSQRTQEFGVRVAFGARRWDVVTLVLGEGIRLATAGLALGVLGAIFLASLLFGVETTDAATYVAVSSMLLCVAALACLLPALRAASINPIDALRTA